MDDKNDIPTAEFRWYQKQISKNPQDRFHLQRDLQQKFYSKDGVELWKNIPEEIPLVRELLSSTPSSQ